MTKKKYALLPEHETQMPAWRDLWISRAMRTAPMTDADREAMRSAVVGLYEAANLKPPPRERIVFVPSPFVGAFAAATAAWIWQERGAGKPSAATVAATGDATWVATGVATRDATGDATWAATVAATRDATVAATGDATVAATWAATGAATVAATWVATEAATEAATGAATWAATGEATEAATEAATRDATGAATEAATGDATGAATWVATEAATGGATVAATGADAHFYRAGACADVARDIIRGRMRINDVAWAMYHGGNMWAGWPAWLSFMRHVCKLPLDYTKWHHYEQAAIHGGPRWMHKEFCIISDFPEALTVDDERRPHAERGPFCRWRDGTAIYAWHGTYVPAWAMERPESITVAKVDAEQNAEVRRALREIMGEGRYLMESGAELVHADVGGARAKGAGPRALLKDKRGDLFLVGTDGSTGRTYYMRAPAGVKTCREAHEALCGFSEDRILNAS